MAIGIGFTPVGQPTVQPEWFKPPLELMANALMSKEKHYSYNRSLLDNYEKTQNALSSMPGKSKDAHKMLQDKWKGMQDDIIDQTGGDLAKADDLLRDYQERLIQDFSGTGLAGKLMSNYENYVNLLKQADEMKTKGLYTEAQYWYVVTRALKEFEDKGGVLGGDEDTGEYKSFYSEPLNPNIDIEEDALKKVKDWMADSKYKDINELESDTKTTFLRKENGYNIYSTRDGTEYVDFEEVYTSLLKSYSGNEKIQQQLKVQYLYEKENGLLRAEYQQTVKNRLENYNEQINNHSTNFNKLINLETTSDKNEIVKQLKAMYGTDHSLLSLSYLKDVIKQYKNREQQSIENANESIKIINDRLQVESEEDLSRSLNLFDFSQDRIKEKIFLASEKSSYSKEFKDVSWLQTKEEKPTIPSGGKGGSTDKPVETFRLKATTTYGIKTNIKEYEKYKNSILEAEDNRLSDLKINISTKLTNEKGFNADSIVRVLDNLTLDNVYKYLDTDGDFNIKAFINDITGEFKGKTKLITSDGKESDLDLTVFTKVLNDMQYQLNFVSRNLLEAKKERIKFNESERIAATSFVNTQGGEIQAFGSKNVGEILKLKPFQEIIEKEGKDGEERLRSELEDLVKLYENIEKDVDADYTFMHFFNDWVKLGESQTNVARRKAFGAKKLNKIIHTGTYARSVDYYDYGDQTLIDPKAPVKYNFEEDVMFNKANIPASELNKLFEKHTPIKILTGTGEKNKGKKYIISNWSTTDLNSNRTYKSNTEFSTRKSITVTSYLEDLERKYKDKKEDFMQERIVEGVMNFVDVPNMKGVLAKVQTINPNTILAITFDDDDTNFNERTVVEHLNEAGMTNIKEIISIQQSQGTVLGSEYLKLTYKGENEDKSTIVSSVYIKRTNESFDVLDENDNSVIPRVHPITASIYNSRQYLTKQGDSGIIHITDIGEDSFYYEKKNGVQSIVKKTKGEKIDMPYAAGLTFMYELYDLHYGVKNLLSSDTSVSDNVLSDVKVNKETIDKSTILRMFIDPLVNDSNNIEEFKNNLLKSFEIDNDGIIRNGMLVLTKDNYNNLADANKGLEIISSSRLDKNKYVEIYDFSGRSVNDLYKLISNKSAGTKIK